MSKIQQISAKRCGTSLLQNIIEHMGIVVAKSHVIIPAKGFVVSAIRDPRNNAISINRFSLLRKKSLSYDLTTEEGVIKLSKNVFLKNNLNVMKKTYKLFHNKPNAHVFRYEDFYNNYEHVIRIIGTKLSIPVDEELIQTINTSLMFDKMKSESDKSNSVKSKFVSKKYRIHGQHIGDDVSPGQWKRKVPKELHELYDNSFKSYCEFLNY